MGHDQRPLSCVQLTAPLAAPHDYAPAHSFAEGMPMANRLDRTPYRQVHFFLHASLIPMNPGPTILDGSTCIIIYPIGYPPTYLPTYLPILINKLDRSYFRKWLASKRKELRPALMHHAVQPHSRVLSLESRVSSNLGPRTCCRMHATMR